MTVNVDEQNYRREQSYNLALAIWSLVEQTAASLRAEGASDATVGVCSTGRRRQDIGRGLLRHRRE